jgi:SSS family solute:Na+ symporter
MAFMGVSLGLIARVAYDKNMFEALGYGAQTALDPEMGLPILLNTILPAGLMGIVLSSNFSAIMSTADSCLMAASGNVQTDILNVLSSKIRQNKHQLVISQIITLGIGALALVLASFMTNVLEMMLYSYAFMVSGLFVPVLAALFGKRPNANAALISMAIGGTTTVVLVVAGWKLPLGLDANIFGISAAFIAYYSVFYITDYIHYFKK